MHLPQVRPVAEPPRLRQLPASVRTRPAAVLVVEEPGEVPPALEALVELDAVRRARSDEPHEFRGVRLVAERLGVQEDRDHRLLDFALRRERGKFALRLPGERQFPLQQLFPFGAFARDLFGRRHPGQLREGRRSALRPRRPEQHRRPDNRARVPRRGFPQADRHRAKHPARALEAVELRPTAVEDLGQVGVEREAGVEPLLFHLRILPRLIVEPAEVADGGDHVMAVAVRIREVLGNEEATAQHLGHILLPHRLHALLFLAAEHVGEIRHQQFSFRVALLRGIGGEQRRHERRPVHPGNRLHEILEEVLNAAPPDGAHPRFLAGVHEDFVHQDQGGIPLPLRTRDELRQQRLGGRSLALLRPALAVEGGQPVIPGELERQHAPRMAERPPLASRPAHILDPPLHVNLVEAERRDEGARELPSDGLPELPHRRQIGKRRRISKEVVERDQRVGLPPAVGEFELAHRLVAPPIKPVRHVLDQLPERVGRKRQREELGRILVHRPRPRPLRHLVEVGGELRQGEFPRLQLLLEAHHLPPRRRPIRFRQVPSPRSTRSTKGYLAPPPPSAWIHTAAAIAATRRETRRDIRPAVRGTRVQRSHGQTPRAMVKLGQPWSKRLQATVNRRIPAHPQRIRAVLRPSVKSDPFRPGVGCIRPEVGNSA